MNRTIVAALAGLLAAIAAPASAGTEEDFERAARAHRAGDHAQAAGLWRQLAQRGQVDAQYNLGLMYYHGDGVARDHAEAARWYRRAAEQGDVYARHRLGLMYLNGEGVAADEAEAHRWLTMSRAGHHHHGHNPQLAAWQERARQLIWQRDMAESLARSKESAPLVVAELQRRAAESAAPRRVETASAPAATVVR